MITGVNHLTLAVRDIEASFTFYHDVLGDFRERFYCVRVSLLR